MAENKIMRDALEIELFEIREQMRGINPKLSSYQKLKERETEILQEIEEPAKPRFQRKTCRVIGCNNLGETKNHSKRCTLCSTHRKHKRQGKKLITEK